jgi:hypothetical protein
MKEFLKRSVGFIINMSPLNNQRISLSKTTQPFDII